MGLQRGFSAALRLTSFAVRPRERDMAVEDAFASHALTKPDATAAPTDKSSDAAVRESGQEPKTKVFISYSRKDIAFADRLDAALKARGFEPLIDRTDIYAFEEWWKRIEALIVRADTIIFVLSPDAVKPDTVALKEVAFAASLNKRFAPIVFRPVPDKDLPEALAKLNFIFFDDPARFEQSADKLAQALYTDIGWIRQHTEYGEAERRWSAGGRPGGLLLHSPILEVAEHWVVSRPRGAPEPTPEIRIFLAESRRRARGAQRVRRLVTASIFTLFVGIIVGLLGWINQEYVKERINWFMTMRPYMLANFRPYVLAPEAERALKPGDLFRECAKECPEMIVIPPGEFVMGSPEAEKGRAANEGPQHRVTIARAFAISRYDVTFDEWDACISVGACSQVSDSGYGRRTMPVTNVTWDDAQRYVAWLAKMTGRPYRLLSEAEWEYAARAGTTTTYFWGNEIGTGNGNCMGCGSEWENRGPAPIGSFKPNAFGLYEMSGNVWQWLQDCFHPDYNGAPADGSAWTSGDCSLRTDRGGSWISGPQNMRLAFRGSYPAGSRNYSLGIRVGRTLTHP
jgi:formylglycine-generating enzyme required for sulfatase activity